jgi:hypothetical protein
MPRRLLWMITVFLCSLFVLTDYRGGEASSEVMPFREGEKVIYRAKWGFIPAGEAVIEILPVETVSGVKAWHFVMTTTTNSQLDLFYKVRERHDSYMDTQLTRTLLYKKRNTGNHPRDVIVTFDWLHGTASRANFGAIEKPISIMPGTSDPLGLFFVIRMNSLKTGKVLEFPVTDGSTNYAVKATVLGMERLTIDGKAYNTFVVTPDMQRLENVFGKKDEPDLKIWFSADEKQVPVKIESKVIIGSFVFELVSATF